MRGRTPTFSSATLSEETGLSLVPAPPSLPPLSFGATKMATLPSTQGKLSPGSALGSQPTGHTWPLPSGPASFVTRPQPSALKVQSSEESHAMKEAAAMPASAINDEATYQALMTTLLQRKAI
ncbi:hypothetical protein LVJ94_31865 [Pendulispora rubella]|uniref:Uncharacterized protein n=1 Tax=Pendulispora rubella TaxID=2741070 RepID=A0ABZ2KS74_9BACT